MYSAQYNGYSLNNLVNSTITKFEGLDEIPSRLSESDLSGADGGNIWAHNYGMRIIEIGGDIFYDDLTQYYDARRAIMAAYSPPPTNRGSTGSRELIVTRPDGVERSIYAHVVGIPTFKETPGEFAEAKYQVLLKAPNPFFTDVVAITGTATLDVPGGFPVPAPVPTPILFGLGNQIFINNTGDFPVFGSFTITGAVVTPTITKVKTGEFIKLNTTLVSGEQVNIYKTQGGDFVEKPSGENMMSYLSGDIFEFDVGITKLIFTGATYSANATLDVEVYPNYLTI